MNNAKPDKSLEEYIECLTIEELAKLKQMVKDDSILNEYNTFVDEKKTRL